MWTRRALVLALPVFAIVAACKGKREESPVAAVGSKAEPAPFTLVLNWVPEPEFGGFYAAKASEAYAREGLAVSIKPGGPGVPALQMVAAGQAQAGITGADELLLAREQGVDVVPVFAVYQHNPQAIMTKAERGAKSLAEVFAAGTVALEPGLPYAQFLKRKYGFENVKVVPYDGGIARLSIEKDFAQQCYLTSEPLAAKRQGVATSVFPISNEGYDPYGAVVVVSRETWTKKRPLVEAFVRATRAGWQNYQKDPKAANEAMHALNKTMDLETFAGAAEAQHALVETHETEGDKVGTMTKARWEALRTTLTELGLVTKPTSFEGWPVD